VEDATATVLGSAQTCRKQNEGLIWAAPKPVVENKMKALIWAPKPFFGPYMTDWRCSCF
jgi:hypothetical protein